MWILTTVVFMVGLGLLALLGIRLHQVLVLVLGYLLSYLLLWTVGPLVDWFAAGPSQPGPFARAVQALNTPQRPATIPALLLFTAPAAMVALWIAAEFDPVLFFLALVVSFSAAQAIRPFSLRQDLLRAIISLPRRFAAEHIGPNWQPPPFGRRRGTGRPQGPAPGSPGGIRVNLPPQGDQQQGGRALPLPSNPTSVPVWTIPVKRERSTLTCGPAWMAWGPNGTWSWMESKLGDSGIARHRDMGRRRTWQLRCRPGSSAIPRSIAVQSRFVAGT